MTGDVSVTGPERIWLHGIGDHAGETTWCDDPNPSGEPEELATAVEYVRADVARTLADEARRNEQERCARVAEAFDDPDRDWLDRSVWDNIKRDTAARIRESAQ